MRYGKTLGCAMGRGYPYSSARRNEETADRVSSTRAGNIRILGKAIILAAGLIAAAMVLSGCGRSPDEGEVPNTGGGSMRFTDVTQEAGITFHHIPPEPVFGKMEPADMTGGAVAEDFNGDGWVDLFVLRGGALNGQVHEERALHRLPEQGD